MIMLKIKTPQECLPEEEKHFIEKVRKGGEVDPNALPRLVKRAKFLAFYEDQDKLVGVGGIKQPYVDHRNCIFENAKSNAIPAEYKIELGWIFVERNFRQKDVGKTIVCGLLGTVKSDKIYAVTRKNNEPMKYILKCKFNFHQSGEEYKSCDGKRSLVLFVRDY